MTRAATPNPPFSALDSHVSPSGTMPSSRSDHGVNEERNSFQPQALRVRDRLHDLQLSRDLQLINERTLRECGPLPSGGLPVHPKRKPQRPQPAVPVMTDTPSFDEDTTMQWKSMAAVAALATGSALTACGAESTAGHVDPPVVAVSDTPVPVQLPTVEAIPPAAEATVAEHVTPADAKAPEPIRGPAIPAAKLRRQILALLGSFEKLEDLERDNVERAFGVRMKIDPEASEGYTYLADTREGWTYWIDTSRLYGKDKPSTTVIHLDDGAESRADQPTHCTLAFEPLAKELVAMGYQQDDEIAKFKGDVWWNFEKKIPHTNAVIYPMVYLYRVSNAHGEGYCIGSIKIQGDATNG